MIWAAVVCEGEGMPNDMSDEVLFTVTGDQAMLGRPNPIEKCGT